MKRSVGYRDLSVSWKVYYYFSSDFDILGTAKVCCRGLYISIAISLEIIHLRDSLTLSVTMQAFI